MIHVLLSSFTLAKWNEGRMCTAFNPAAASERRCFMPFGILIRKSLIHPLMFNRHRRVIHAEVADMQLIHTHVAETAQRRRDVPIPSKGLGLFGLEIGDPALGPI